MSVRTAGSSVVYNCRSYTAAVVCCNHGVTSAQAFQRRWAWLARYGCDGVAIATVLAVGVGPVEVRQQADDEDAAPGTSLVRLALLGGPQ